MKKFLIFISLIVLISGTAFADPVVSQSFYYVFHLYYDNGQIVADRDFKYPYDVIPGEFQPDAVIAQFPYRGDIINFPGEIANHFTFDPKQGDAKFVKGKISVKAPYVADGQKAVFFDPQNNPILTITVSESSFCNDDGICNEDRGEDSLSCPKDCKQSLPAPPVTSPNSETGSSKGIVSGIIYTLIGIILLGLLWWFLRRRGRGQTPPTLNFPNSSLPTPPTPPSSGNGL